MNGNKLFEIQNMTEGEFKVYLSGQLEMIHKDMTAIKKKQGAVESKIANVPTRAEYLKWFSDCSERVGVLEKEQIGRKAVNKVFLGAGSLSIVSMVLLLLKFVFKAI